MFVYGKIQALLLSEAIENVQLALQLSRPRPWKDFLLNGIDPSFVLRKTYVVCRVVKSVHYSNLNLFIIIEKSVKFTKMSYRLLTK